MPGSPGALLPKSLATAPKLSNATWLPAGAGRSPGYIVSWHGYASREYWTYERKPVVVRDHRPLVQACVTATATTAAPAPLHVHVPPRRGVRAYYHTLSHTTCITV